MIEQIGNAVKFVAFFVATKVGKPGLADVTVDVFNPAGAQVVTGAAATEIGGGLYAYTLGSGSVTTEGEYAAVFKTADATVDQQHLPALWVVGRAGVERLDASIAAITPGLVQRSEPPTVIAVADQVWDEALAGHVVAGSAGAQLTATASVTDPLLNPVPGAYVAGSAGYVLGRIGTADLVTQGPVAADGATLTLVRGDDYKIAEGRQIVFSSASWPDLTDSGTDPVVTLTIRRRAEAFGTGSDGVLLSTTDVVLSRVAAPSGTQYATFELSKTLTAALLPGTGTGKYDVQAVLSSGSVVTLAAGLVDVTEDQTR